MDKLALGVYLIVSKKLFFSNHQFSFRLDDYRKHTSCLTEVERYEKRTPSSKSAKTNPQDQWMELIRDSIATAPGHLKQYLETMAGLDNVPRKEKQFRNFTTNSLNLSKNKGAENIVSGIWSHLKGLREKQLAERAEAQAKVKKDDDLVVTKRVEDDSTEKKVASDDNDVQSSEGKLDAKTVKKAMKKVLKKSKDRSMTEKFLRKAVQEHLGLSKDSKSDIKALVKTNVASSKDAVFEVKGKTISLKVD
jgi:hypothetical protein